MASRDGKIVFENTLDARLELAYRKKLPEVYFALHFSFGLFISEVILHGCHYILIDSVENNMRKSEV